MRQIDEKYKTSGDITRINGEPVPEDEPLILFRGHDTLLLPLLDKYRELCIQAGCPEKQLELLSKRVATIKKWQDANSDKMVLPTGSHVA